MKIVEQKPFMAEEQAKSRPARFAEEYGFWPKEEEPFARQSPNSWLMRKWKRMLAFFRWDLDAVCEMSQGKGEHDDYHDYHDSILPQPLHHFRHTCERCGKRFYI